MYSAATCKGCSLQILIQIVSTLDEHDWRQMWKQCLPEGMIYVTVLWRHTASGQPSTAMSGLLISLLSMLAALWHIPRAKKTLSGVPTKARSGGSLHLSK